MKHEDKELLQFIRQNAQMGTVTLSKLKDMLDDGFMKDVIGKQLDEYNEIFESAGNELITAGEDTKEVSGVMQTMATAMLDMQSIADKSDSHIAEMVILGSTRGVIQLVRRLRDCKGASNASVGLAYRLLVTEQNDVDELKRFL